LAVVQISKFLLFVNINMTAVQTIKTGINGSPKFCSEIFHLLRAFETIANVKVKVR